VKNLLIDDISDDVLGALSDQAEARGDSLEEHARRNLCDALGVSPLDGKPFVSVEFLRDNHEAVFDAAKEQPVYVFDAACNSWGSKWSTIRAVGTACGRCQGRSSDRLYCKRLRTKFPTFLSRRGKQTFAAYASCHFWTHETDIHGRLARVVISHSSLGLRCPKG